MRKAIPWERLIKKLLMDFLWFFSILFICFFTQYLSSASRSELPITTLVTTLESALLVSFVFAIALAAGLWFIHLFLICLILDYSFGKYYNKLGSLRPITSSENFRLTLRSVYLSHINAPFWLTILIIILLIGSFIIHEIIPTIQSDFATYVIVPVLGLIAGSSVIRVNFVIYPNAITGEYEVKLNVKRSKRESISKTPVVFIRTLTSKNGRLALLASIKNPLTQELVVEGRAYSIPPYESGRVTLSQVGIGSSEERSFVIIPPRGTVKLELYLKSESPARNHSWEKGGFFALIHLRFVHYQRNGRLTSSFKTLLGMPFEELHKERNVVLVCYLDPQDERAEVVYEFPGWL